MEGVVLRLSEEKDIHEMAELDKICFRVPWSEVSFESEIKENDRALYVTAEADGKVVGYAGLWVIFDEGHITNVAVHPDFRGKGLGREIVEFLIAEGEKEGVTSQTLEVRPSNMPALALYGRLGFTEEGRRKGYYEDNGEDAIIMWRHNEKGK